MPALKAAASDESPFGGKNAPRKTRDVHWLKPELVAEIEFAGWTGDGNVRQAAFKGLRQDKAARRGEGGEPVMTKVAQPAVAKARSSRRSRCGADEACRPEQCRGDGRRHLPSRQGDVAGCRRRRARHQARSRALFRGGRRMDDRRISRAGRARSCARPTASRASNSSSATACRAPRSCWSWSRSPATASPICRSTASKALAAVAQVGGLELHPWNCAPDQYDVPGRLVFDLDPAPDVEFADVIEAAKAMREQLSSASAWKASARPPAARACMSWCRCFTAPGTG